MKPTKYFAARNGYEGFKSYFKEIFPSERFDSLYLLKGGPGTGKSSMMKEIADKLTDYGAECDRIYCSSDPHSLDGIIAQHNGHSVAMIDATAPHQRDTEIPGAIDEIINLGEGWDKRWLKAQKEKIIALDKEKKAAYRRAYLHLGIAGKFDELKRSERVGFKNNKMFVSKVYSLADFVDSEGSGSTEYRLSDAFSRYGEYSLDSYQKSARRVVYIVGSRRAREEVLRLLTEYLMFRHVDLVLSPTPFDNRYFNAIYLSKYDVAFVLKRTADAVEKIDADEMLFCSDIKFSSDDGVDATVIKESLLEAKRWFGIAADLHSRLEEIYSSSMNFERNNEICGKILLEFKEILTL